MGHEVRRAVLDNQVRVTTPENIAFQYQIAGPFRRIIAYALDILLAQVCYGILCVLIGLLFAFGIAPLASYLGLQGLAQGLAGLVTGLLLAGFFALNWFYGAFTETYYNGQSPGKMMTGLRVLSTDGHAIDGVQGTLRNFFRLVDLLPMLPLSFIFSTEQYIPIGPPCCLMALLVMSFSSRYQRVGDLVAGTIVVVEERKWTPALASFTDSRVPMLADEIPADYVVAPSMAKALAEFVDRRRYLPGQRVAEIASHLGVPLIERFGLMSNTNHDLLLCALYYRTFISSQLPDEPSQSDFPQVLKTAPQPWVPPVVNPQVNTANQSPGYSDDFRYDQGASNGPSQ